MEHSRRPLLPALRKAGEAMKTCSDCGFELTPEEVHYYIHRCETCERIEHERLQLWKAGADDPKYDAMYGSDRAGHA